jgi:hypothetical protein
MKEATNHSIDARHINVDKIQVILIKYCQKYTSISREVIINVLKVLELVRKWKLAVGLISCERNLLPLGEKSPLCSYYSINLKKFRHTQHRYIFKVTSFGPQLIIS